MASIRIQLQMAQIMIIERLFIVIVDAIVLLTGKFDRNLIYLQELANTGDTEPDTLNTVVAILGITLPVMAAIIGFIFFCCCFTRADSPICKIFEPQA